MAEETEKDTFGSRRDTQREANWRANRKGTIDIVLEGYRQKKENN